MNNKHSNAVDDVALARLAQHIKQWGLELGFAAIGISDIDLAENEAYLDRWLSAGYHGEMAYMAAHGTLRSRPAENVPGTVRAITSRMDYLPDCTPYTEVLANPALGAISRYALGRDYHKMIRKRLQKLGERIRSEIHEMGGTSHYRVFCDSAPVLERALAEKSGIGFVGKHANLISPVSDRSGSWFFLGEIYTDLPLPVDERTGRHCGDCSSCIDACPTGAITQPYNIDARRCISYLTIELKGAIPENLRPLIGNRIYGCDDCQIVCPWNRFAKYSNEPDFAPRHGLDKPALAELFGWDEKTFLSNTEGSPLRRLNHERWLRNIAVALGNALANAQTDKSDLVKIHEALRSGMEHKSPLVREHVAWALKQKYAQ